MGKILLSGYHSNNRNGNPPRMWSNTSKIGFAERAPKQPRAAARQEPDLAYSEAAGLKRGRVRPPRELVYAAEASPGSRGTIIAAIFIRCPAQGTLLTFGLFNATPDNHPTQHAGENPDSCSRR